MKKIYLKLFVKIFSGVALAYGIYSYACAGHEYGIYNSTFSPEIAVKRGNYTPLFLDYDYLFYNNLDTRDKFEFFKKEDIKAWKEYLGGKVADEVIEFYLYNNSIFPDEFKKWVDAMSKDISIKLPQNIDAKTTKIDNFLQLIYFARETENYTNQTYDYWDYENREQLKADESLVEFREELYNSISEGVDDFYKNRLWFQIIRLKFYSTDRTSVIDFFNKTADKQPKNSLYYRALNYVSGAYKSVKNYKQNNIILAKIFNEYPPLIQSAVFEYRPLEKEEFNEILKGLSPDEQDALWAMQGYYGDEFLAMQNIYKLNPKSKNIDFLLTRYINKLEYKVNSEKIKEYKKNIQNIDFSKNEWIIKVAEENKVKNPYLWNLAGGYLSIYSSDFNKAEEFFKKAKILAENKPQKLQVRLLNFLNEITRLDKIDRQDEQKLTEDLKWIRDTYYYLPKKNDLEFIRIPHSYNFIFNYLSELYAKKDDKIRAELTNHNYEQNFYENSDNFLAMESFMLKKNHTEWDEILLQHYPFNLGDIYHYRAILAFYKNDIDTAIQEFKKSPIITQKTYNFDTNKYENVLYDYKKNELYANPFNGRIKDCADCDHKAQKGKTKRYTILSVLETIKKMQENIENNIDVYNNALLVGNAFYNMSYYGNGRAFYYNAILNEYGIHISNKNIGLVMISGMQNAEKYYKIAKKYAQNDEQKAKIAYLLAKVERNNFYTNNNFSSDEYYYPYDEKNIMFKEWKGFKELKDNYSNTKYYQEVLKECGYFQKYISKN